MNKLLIALTVLLLSGTASAYWLQTTDYNSPNDSIEETPTQVDDDAQPYAPSDLPVTQQNNAADPNAYTQPSYQDNNTPPNPNTEESDGDYDDE